MQVGYVVARREPEAVVKHHGLDVGIEHRREHAVLEAADLEGRVFELVVRPAQAAHFVPGALPVGGIVRRDDQHLEVRTRGGAAVEVGRNRIDHAAFIVGAGVPCRLVAAEIRGQQRVGDLAKQPCEV